MYNHPMIIIPKKKGLCWAAQMPTPTVPLLPMVATISIINIIVVMEEAKKDSDGLVQLPCSIVP